MNGQQLLQEVQQYETQLRENRRYLHSHPETGFALTNTVAFVKEKLVAMGYEPQNCGKAGVMALVGGKRPGKVFLLRADMDALPIQEAANIKFAAVNGNMHACGHDLHVAMLLGAAQLLKQHENEIEGTVKLMFQPAEEIFAGARDMLDAGILKNPDVDAAMMIHIVAAACSATGTVAIPDAGVGNPAADFFEIEVQGKGCHGSMPNTGVDPVTVAAHILLALQELHARELAMADRAALTIGMFHAGEAANVIPDMAVMSGSIRTYDEETRAFLKNRLVDVAQHTAEAFRAKAQVTFGGGCPTLWNQKELVASVKQYTKELLGTEWAIAPEDFQAAPEKNFLKQGNGSEDFAYVSRQVPTVMLALAAGQPEKGYVYPQHHPKVIFDESVLVFGCAVYVYNAMRWLEEHKASGC